MSKIISIIGFIVIIIGMAIGGGVGKEVGKAAFSPPKPSAQEIESKMIERLRIAVEQTNKRGPIMVDKDTQFDRAEVGPGARLTNYYSFPNYSSRDFDSAWVATTKRMVTNMMCANKEVKPFLQNGAIYGMSYTSGDGVEFAHFELSRNDCT